MACVFTPPGRAPRAPRPHRLTSNGWNADVNRITVVTFHITQTSHVALVNLNRVKRFELNKIKQPLVVVSTCLLNSETYSTNITNYIKINKIWMSEYKTGPLSLGGGSC